MDRLAGQAARPPGRREVVGLPVILGTFEPADVIKAGCGVSGLYDLEPIRLCYLNDILKLTPEAARLNSPVHQPPKRSGPLVLPVGGLEGPEYHRQTDDLAAAWRTRGLPCEAVHMPGLHHFSIVSQLEDPKSELSRLIATRMLSL